MVAAEALEVVAAEALEVVAIEALEVVVWRGGGNGVSRDTRGGGHEH